MPRYTRLPEIDKKLPSDEVTAKFAERLPPFIAKVAKYDPDLVVAVGSSGRIVAHFLRKRLGLKKVFFLNKTFKIKPTPRNVLVNNPLLEKAAKGKRVLVVDDFTGYGDTSAMAANYLRRLSPSQLGLMSMTHYRSLRGDALAALSKKYEHVDLGEGVDSDFHALRGSSPGPMIGTAIFGTNNYDRFLKKVEALLEKSGA